MTIKETNTVDEALQASISVVEVFKTYKVDCPGCKGIRQCTIEKLAFNNGIDLAALLSDLNSALKK